jgi:D-alanyl-D-alanine carboxypeptidase/D-alanyl-D-alanine-endopeptidase (penicillin-binding protein 4)
VIVRGTSEIGPTIKVANTRSQNFYAECLMKSVGAAASGTGSWDTGRKAIEEWLTGTCHVPRKAFTIADGSGLSAENRLSARAVASVLRHMFAGDGRDTYVASMAVSGESGTLKRRMTGPDVRGRVHAKTGYVKGAVTLSGYVHARSGKWYVFSILVNDYKKGTAAVRKVQDALASRLAAL